MNKKLGSIFAVAVVMFLTAATARAETFYANLQGAQETPAVATTATGYARVVVNEPALTYSFTVVFSGLTSAQNNAHIHAPGAIGASAGVIINFGVVGGTSGTITGSGAITAGQIAQLRSHLGYVNVHSVNFPAGELRGQLGIKRPVDFDGDGRMDLSILRFPAGACPGPLRQITYWNQNTTGVNQIQNWGDACTDFPVPGDYDGDGKDDLAIYRDGATAGSQSEMWIFRSSDNIAQRIFFGLNGDQPFNRDYDGDGKTDLAVFRRGAAVGAQAIWYIRKSTSGPLTNPGEFVIPFGTTGDLAGGTSGDFPVPGDYDGDGKFDLAVYRFGIAPLNNYIVLRSLDNSVVYQQFGDFNTDFILPGDYDGDGKFDFAIARFTTNPAPLVWWILQSSNGQVRIQNFGIGTDLPAQGDYDGDARTDIAIFRTSTSSFWVFNSFTNAASVTKWGQAGDFPVNTFDIR
jgi:hypothetical protein